MNKLYSLEIEIDLTSVFFSFLFKTNVANETEVEIRSNRQISLDNMCKIYTKTEKFHIYLHQATLGNAITLLLLFNNLRLTNSSEDDRMFSENVPDKIYNFPLFVSQ